VIDDALLDRVRSRLADAAAHAGDPRSALAEVTPAAVAAALRLEGAVLGDLHLLDVVAALGSELAGLGVLQPLLLDPDVTDVLVNGAGDVWIDRGGGLVRSAVAFSDERAVRRLAQRLASGAGRRLDDAVPFVDVRLAAGIRMHAVLAPTALGGSCLSLRVGRRRAFTLDQLVDAGSLPAAASDLLRDLVASRLSTLVSGGTGTGKTTVLATLIGCVDDCERVVVVEDSGELAPDHPHVVRLEGRPSNVEGAGAITVGELVRQALRMRPDRLVVGEVRGAEVVDLMAALNTGHDGGFGTVHANSVRDVPARLEGLALAAGLGRAALHSQLAAGVHAVVHLVRDRNGQRRVAEVGVPTLAESGLVAMLPAYVFSRAGTMTAGPGATVLAGRLLGNA
jgi:pilus assembly protein CpaF